VSARTSCTTPHASCATAYRHGTGTAAACLVCSIACFCRGTSEVSPSAGTRARARAQLRTCTRSHAHPGAQSIHAITHTHTHTHAHAHAHAHATTHAHAHVSFHFQLPFICQREGGVRGYITCAPTPNNCAATRNKPGHTTCLVGLIHGTHLHRRERPHSAKIKFEGKA
jgi:hypothetical protein